MINLRFGLAAILFLPLAVYAESIVPVSSSAALQQALNTVPNNGVVELAAGSYNAPSGGWTIYPQSGGESRTFTVRAASGANVVLSGAGSTKVLKLTTPQPVTFERLTFANGVSTDQYQAGGVSLARTQANFISCNFENNAANAPGSGGGGLWIDTSTVSFQGCTWTRNSSLNYGAGMSLYQSRVYIRNSQFVGNFSNPPGHSYFSTGGAIHAESSTLNVANSRFDSNQAGYVGGAIYAVGPWQDPVTTPRTDLLVTNCSFNGNSVSPKSGFTAPPTGGAIMLEDQVRARIYNSRFTQNTATQGGALSSYRATAEVQNCVFQSNHATGTGDPEGFGGAIIVLSDDNADASTSSGTINRPSGRLTVTDTLIRGGGANDPVARQGGGIFVAGDLHATYGIGVTRNGTPDSNRVIVKLKRVVFADLATSDRGNGTGGALTGDFADVTVDDCIVQNCRASHFGGGFEFVRGSKATVRGTTVAGNYAGQLGGGITAFGGELNLDRCNLVDNSTASEAAGGYGSALTTSEDPGQAPRTGGDMIGVVQNCVFSNNTVTPAIYDGDNPGVAYVNRLQYNGNTMFSGSTGAFYTDVAGMKTMSQLNVLSLLGVSKSSGGNTTATAPSPAGAILVVPPMILQGAPGEKSPLPSYLAYASSGGTPMVDSAAQRASSGVFEIANPGRHSLTVGGAAFSTSPLPGAALNISTRLAAGQGENALIAGFVIVGNEPKRVIVRAIGPSLPVAGALQDPTLQLFESTGKLVASNDNWEHTNIGGVLNSEQSVELVGTGIAPTKPSESAVVVTLAPGAYTAVIQGANNSTGVGMVDAFDLDAIQTSALANISTRGSVQQGDGAMIAGLIYAGGPGATRVVLRAVGPSLAAQGLRNALKDPVLELHDQNGGLVISNDDWEQSPDAAAIRRTGLQPSSSVESAVMSTSLARGAYTAVVRGKGNSVGVGLIEAYIFE